jgi:hypothetical protein
MIAGEKKAILVEQAYMAAGMTRHRNESQALIKLNCLISVDHLLHTAQTSTGIGTVDDPPTAKVLLKELVIGYVVAMSKHHPTHSPHFFQPFR